MAKLTYSAQIPPDFNLRIYSPFWSYTSIHNCSKKKITPKYCFSHRCISLTPLTHVNKIETEISQDYIWWYPCISKSNVKEKGHLQNVLRICNNFAVNAFIQTWLNFMPPPSSSHLLSETQGKKTCHCCKLILNFPVSHPGLRKNT